MKIPVLLADDEYLLRSLVKRIINWDDLGLEVVCEASDGEEAIQLIEQHHPKIAIIDINMPFINGLELARIISERFSHIQVIILTGYPDFTYAQEALRAKAVNYITKPIDAQELKNALTIARDSIKAQEHFNREYVNLMSEAFRGQSAVKSDYLRRLVNGVIKDDDPVIIKQFAQWDERWQSCGFIVIVVSIETVDSSCSSPPDQVLYLNALANIALEIISQNRSCEALIELDMTITLIAGMACQDWNHQFKQLENDCLEIVRLSEQYLKISPSMTIGSCQQSPTMVTRSYSEAIHLMKERFYRHEPILVLQPDAQKTTSLNVSLPADTATKIHSLLLLGHFKQAHHSVEHIFIQAEQNRVPEEFIKSVSLNLLSVFQTYLAEKNLTVPNGSLNDMIALALSASSIHQLRSLVLDRLSTITTLAESVYDSVQMHPIVRNALVEIDQRYHEPILSLDQIAKTLFVNPSYLSTLFKRETGQTLTEYLVDFRMKKAISLIKTDIRRDISEVASAVGYRDVYYFARCFKRHFGSSPYHVGLS